MYSNKTLTHNYLCIKLFKLYVVFGALESSVHVADIFGECGGGGGAGVHRVRCDMASQTVVVSGNVPPHTLLRRVKWIKRHSSLMSYGAAPSAYSATQLYVDPGAELVPAYTPYSTGGVAGELPPPVYTPYSTGVVYEPRPGNLLEYDVGYERPYSSSYSYY